MINQYTTSLSLILLVIRFSPEFGGANCWDLTIGVLGLEKFKNCRFKVYRNTFNTHKSVKKHFSAALFTKLTCSKITGD